MILESCPKITGNDPPGSPGESQWRQRSPPLTAACFTFLLRIFCPRPPDSRVGTPSRGSSQQHPPTSQDLFGLGPKLAVAGFFVGGMEIHESKVTSIIFENKTSHNLCVFQTTKRAQDSKDGHWIHKKEWYKLYKSKRFDSLNCPKIRSSHKEWDP